MLVRRSTIAARAFFQIESPCLLNWMVALLFPFGSPEKDALTLIESKVEDSVKDPGVVDAKAEPEKSGRRTREPPSPVSHDRRVIVFLISPLPGLLTTSPGRTAPNRPGPVSAAHPARHCSVDARHVNGWGLTSVAGHNGVTERHSVAHLVSVFRVYAENDDLRHHAWA